MREYFKEVDLLRGMAITMVILGHAIIVFPINLHKIYWCEFIFNAVSSVHMPMFFIVSGICYSSKNSFGEYINKKIRRLIIPYIFFCMMNILMRVMFPNLVNSRNGLSSYIISAILFGGGYWFLYVLFIIFLVFPFFEKITKSVFGLKWLIFFFLFLLQFKNIHIRLFLFGDVIYYIYYFMLGWILKKYLNKIKRMCQKSNYLIFCTYFSLLIWIILIYIQMDLINMKILEFLTTNIGVIFFYLFSIKILDKKNYFFMEFSKYSLPLYLLNGYLLVISRILIINILHINNPLLIIMGNIFVTLFVSWGVYKFIIDKTIFRKIFGML